LPERDRGEPASGNGKKGTRTSRRSNGGGGSRGGIPIDEIDLEGKAEALALAHGATVPLRVRAFDRLEDGTLEPVAASGLKVRTDPPGVVEIDEDYRARGITTGATTLWFETEDGSVQSNKATIEVVGCTGAAIGGLPERLLLQGEKHPLKITYSTPAGDRDDLLHDAAIDEIGTGRVNRHGIFSAANKEGAATIRVRWGTNSNDTAAVSALIGPDRLPPKKGIEGDIGGDIPLILLCGTPVPGTEHYPPEQRTILPSEFHPTIIDFDPAFENVIFINPDSKESIQTRKGRGGRKGMMGIATDTYYQFVALKCFEILKRLWVFEQAREAPLTEVQFRERFATAETECAPFIEDAYKIAEAIADSGGSPTL
jgi:hypothetical protein